ncbi:MAG TPA: peroxiredoxin [Candidatus Lumbricidophila sp.]|nr:peroxiredoxin [Candidatus Lumbricidophila sp.]
MILTVGAVAPEFSLIDQHGAETRLSALIERMPVALVFFPLAFSSTCEGELCELRDNLADFDQAGVQLVGISVDSKHALRAWADREGYSFSLLADFWPHGEVAHAYGAFREDRGFADRATFLIGTDGVIVDSFVTAPGIARPLSRYRAALAQLGPAAH